MTTKPLDEHYKPFIQDKKALFLAFFNIKKYNLVAKNTLYNIYKMYFFTENRKIKSFFDVGK
jgi:hypothetical protein